MAQIKTNLQYGVTGTVQSANIANDAIDSQHYADGSLDTAHIADDQVTLAKMASGTDGNVITYDASGNPAVVAVGTSGHFLKSQGAGSQPVFAAAGGGKIGQVLQATTGTFTSIQSTSYSTVITRTITPVATSSKILAMCTANFGMGAGSHKVQAKISRTTVAAGTESFPIGDLICAMQGTDHNETGRSTTHIYLDSPSETNEVTYTLVFRSSATEYAYINNYNAGGQNVSTLTVMEILA